MTPTGIVGHQREAAIDIFVSVGFSPFCMACAWCLRARAHMVLSTFFIYGIVGHQMTPTGSVGHQMTPTGIVGHQREEAIDILHEF